MTFNPNTQTFAQGVDRIRKAATKAGMRLDGIITSRDAAVLSTKEDLTLKEALEGFNKWLLPVHLDGPALLSFSYGGPNLEVPEHSHDEGDGIRVILHGSISHKGKTLTAGDWMFMPKGTKYSFSVGPEGVGMFYCYLCCCV